MFVLLALLIAAASASEQELQPAMTAPERKLLVKFMQNTNGDYIEFGVGGSTFLAAGFTNLKTITSVESDEQWVKKLQTYRQIELASKHGRLRFIYINYGAVGACAHPLDKSSMHLWPLYSEAVQLAIPPNGVYRLVLVDGRFRIACALKALYAIDSNSAVLIHDYERFQSQHNMSNGEVAPPLNAYYEAVEWAERLIALRKRRFIDDHKLKHDIDKFQLAPL